MDDKAPRRCPVGDLDLAERRVLVEVLGLRLDRVAGGHGDGCGVVDLLCGVQRQRMCASALVRRRREGQAVGDDQQAAGADMVIIPASPRPASAAAMLRNDGVIVRPSRVNLGIGLCCPSLSLGGLPVTPQGKPVYDTGIAVPIQVLSTGSYKIREILQAK